MNANLSWADWLGGQMGNDQRDVTRSGNHRVGTVDRALRHGVTTVGVHVADDPQLAVVAEVPEGHEAFESEGHAAGKRLSVEVVVVGNLNDGCGWARSTCEQERAGFSLPAGPTAKIVDQSLPLSRLHSKPRASMDDLPDQAQPS